MTEAQLNAAVARAEAAMAAAEGAQTALQNVMNNQPRAQLMTTVEDFSGKDDEDFEQFEQAPTSSLNLAGIPNGQRYNYLRLRLSFVIF